MDQELHQGVRIGWMQVGYMYMGACYYIWHVIGKFEVSL